MKQMNKKGFTIVELVIVIAVIAILAAVLIPTFSGVVARANASAALQEATSVMKSSLAMSDSATLADNTIFAIGDANGVNYEFTYSGNKITETAKSGDAYAALVPSAGGTPIANNATLSYDRIIINADMITGVSADNAGVFKDKDSAKVQQIIKKAFGDKTGNAVEISLVVKPAEYKDANAAAYLSVKVGSADAVTISVYVNSDYPTDAVTFVPATREN